MRANALALADLEGGADALTLTIANGTGARGFGVAPTFSALNTAFRDVELDLIAVRVDGGTAAVDAADAFAALVHDRRLGGADLAIDFGCDPGGLDDRALGDLARRVRSCSGRATALLADGRSAHEAGASEAQELAVVLASAVEQLRRLEACGLDLDEARRLIAVLLAVDADVLLGIAKIRAMRRLWRRLETCCGLSERALRLHAETSWRMMTLFDPHSNVMRASAACFAAGVGGADVITVLPFTLVAGLPDAPARRLARNTSRVLMDEAELGRVDDPAAGSGAIEALTDGLARTAWSLFQQIEAEGGLSLSAEQPHGVVARLAETGSDRLRDHAALARRIVGTSLFPRPGDPAPHVLDAPRRPADRGARWRSRRDAEIFEEVRSRVDRAKRRLGVHLVSVDGAHGGGPAAAYVKDLLTAAGLDIREANPDEAPSAIICLTGRAAPDEERITTWIARLRRGGARRVLMAGDPGENAVAWRGLGVDAFLHPGCAAAPILADLASLAGDDAGVGSDAAVRITKPGRS